MDGRTIGTVLFLVIMAGVVYIWSQGSDSDAPVPSEPASATTQTPVAGTDTSAPVQMGDVRQFNQQSESVAIARSMYLELSNLGGRVETRLSELRSQRDKWNTQISGLLKNQDGLFIAAEQADAAAFRAHYENVPTLPDEELDGFQETLDAMMGPIKSALQGQGVTGTPNPEFGPRLKALETQIKDVEKPFRDSIPAIEAILATAKNRGQKGSQTLQSVLDDMKEAEAVTRAARIEAARKKAEDEVTQQLAKAEADRVLADGEKKRQEIESEANELRATAAADAIKSRATNPDTLKRLEPFVTKSTIAFTCDIPSRFRWTGGQTQARPISFGAMSRFGALEKSENGIRRLYELATTRENNRPKWPMASTPADWEWATENQTLLRELGTTLVELGYLEP